MAPVSREVTQPPFQVQETLVCLLKACLHKPFRCEIRCCHCITLHLNEGKWCNVSATMAPKLNNLKWLNYQNVNRASLHIFMGFSHEQDLFFDPLNRSYNKDRLYVLLYIECQLQHQCSFRCSLWIKLTASCSNITEPGIIMTHPRSTLAIQRLSKQKPIVDDWDVMTQQICLMEHHRSCLTTERILQYIRGEIGTRQQKWFEFWKSKRRKGRFLFRNLSYVLSEEFGHEPVI